MFVLIKLSFKLSFFMHLNIHVCVVYAHQHLSACVHAEVREGYRMPSSITLCFITLRQNLSVKVIGSKEKRAASRLAPGCSASLSLK